MSYEFFDNSEKAKTPSRNPVGVAKYPWKVVPVGKSFPVPRENIKFSVLRSLASRTGKELGKKFKCVDHGSGPYEVACLQMTQEEAVQSSSNVVEALQKIDSGGFSVTKVGDVVVDPQIATGKPFSSQDEAMKIAAYARENNMSIWEAQKVLAKEGE